MNNGETPFSGNEITDLCNTISDIHRILKTIGEFYTEIDKTTDNAMIADFKKWGVRTITDQMLEKQYERIEELKKVYSDEQKKIW